MEEIWGERQSSPEARTDSRMRIIIIRAGDGSLPEQFSLDNKALGRSLPHRYLEFALTGSVSTCSKLDTLGLLENFRLESDDSFVG